MKLRFIFVSFCALFVMLSCNMPVAPATGAVTPTGALDVLTAAAKTAQAGQTLPATAQPGPATLTPPPANTAAPATSTPQPCDQAAFVQDVTVPDGTRMLPGQAFTKTWRLRNLGTCTWNASYALVFTGGDAMGAPAVVNLPGNVPPNSMADLSIEMKAPSAAGTYRGNWKLRNATGGIFDVSGGNIYVEIQVAPNTLTPTITPTQTITPTVTITPTATNPAASGIIYDFAANLCKAEWRSQSGVLPCKENEGGTEGDPRGFMRLVNNRALENGTTPAIPVLLTVPDATKTGAITATFPVVTIQQGYRFKASFGCVQNASQCSVVYQVNYLLGSDQLKNLEEKSHAYSGSLKEIDIDLSPLAGQSIKVVLVVLANGSAEGDQAVWLHPRIEKP